MPQECISDGPSMASDLPLSARWRLLAEGTAYNIFHFISPPFAPGEAARANLRFPYRLDTQKKGTPEAWRGTPVWGDRPGWPRGPWGP